MKNVNLIFRRTHLYLGMLLIPWVFIYAFSTFIFNHRPTFKSFRGKPSDWVQQWEKDYQVDLPEGQEKLKILAGKILKENGIEEKRYGVRRSGQRLEINMQKFLIPERLVYQGKTGKLTGEKRRVFWAEVFTRLHIRHGWGKHGLLNGLWSFTVDLVCLAFLTWMFTGLYLWWKIPSTRRWGFVALGSGFLSFVLLLMTL